MRSRVTQVLSMMASVLLVGCVTTKMSPQEVKSAQLLDLCKEYNGNKESYVKNEITFRMMEAGKMPDWRTIDRGSVTVGMHLCEVFAAKGFSQSLGGVIGGHDTVNRTSTARGDRYQWVFRNTQFGPAMYVYTENNYVVAVQD